MEFARFNFYILYEFNELFVILMSKIQLTRNNVEFFLQCKYLVFSVSTISYLLTACLSV